MDFKKYQDVIGKYVDAHKEDIIKDLMDLVSVPGAFGKAEENAPFGPEPAMSLEAAAKLFEKNGFTVERHAARGYALARIGEGKKVLGLFCHCDVVPVKADEWLFAKPYEPKLIGDILVGRGVKDDKGAVIASLYAIKAILDAGIKLDEQILVFLGSNEETGMKDVMNFLEDQKKPDFSIVPDCEYIVCRGEKSYCPLTTRSLRKFENILDFTASNMHYVIAKTADVVIRNVGNVEKELNLAVSMRTNCTLEKTEDGNFHLHVEGISAHGAAPYGTYNAVGCAAGVLLQCLSLGHNDLYVLGAIQVMTGDCCTYFFGTNFFDETKAFRPTSYSNFGIKMVDGCPELDGGFNLASYIKYKPFAKKVQKALTQAGWTCEIEQESWGYLLDADDKRIKGLEAAYRSLCSQESRGIYTNSANTYAFLLKQAVAIGLDAPITVIPENFPMGHGGLHQADECVNVESFCNGVKILTSMILSVDGEL